MQSIKQPFNQLITQSVNKSISKPINQSINNPPLFKKSIKFIVASLFSKYQVSGSYCDTSGYSERQTTDQEPGKSDKEYTAEFPAELPGSQAFKRLDPEENKAGGITTNITHKECVDNKVEVKAKAISESGPSTDNH